MSEVTEQMDNEIFNFLPKHIVAPWNPKFSERILQLISPDGGFLENISCPIDFAVALAFCSITGRTELTLLFTWLLVKARYGNVLMLN